MSISFFDKVEKFILDARSKVKPTVDRSNQTPFARTIGTLGERGAFGPLPQIASMVATKYPKTALPISHFASGLDVTGLAERASVEGGRLPEREKYQTARTLGGVTSGLIAGGPKMVLRAAGFGAGLGGVVKAGTNLYNNKPITQDILPSAVEGATFGAKSSATFALTNSVVNSLASKIPFMNSLTEKAIGDTLPKATMTIGQAINNLGKTGLKRIIKAALIETPIEGVTWGLKEQGENQSLLESISDQTVQNLIYNVGFAGVNTAWDGRVIAPIIKKSIDQVIDANPKLQAENLNLGLNVKAKGGNKAIAEAQELRDSQAGLYDTKPFTETVYRGVDEKGISRLNRPEAGNALGEGNYYAQNISDASKYGSRIEEKTITLKKPLIIKTDQDLRNATNMSSLWNKDPLVQKQMIADARQRIISSGHDGVVIKMGDYQDTQNLRDLFGHNQVIDFTTKKGQLPVNTSVLGPTPSKDILPQKNVAQQPLSDLAQEARKYKSAEEFLANKHPYVKSSIDENATDLILRDIKVSPEKQGRGYAESFIRDVVDYSKKTNKPVYLTPTDMYGSDKTRLTDLFRRNGFVDNAGREKMVYRPSDIYNQATKQSPQISAVPSPIKEVSPLQAQKGVSPTGKLRINPERLAPQPETTPQAENIRKITLGEEGLTKATENMQQVRQLTEQGIGQGDSLSASSVRDGQSPLSPMTQTRGIRTKPIQQTSDDIIANAKKEISTSPKEKPESLRQSFDRFYTQWVDRYNPVVKASEFAEKKAGVSLETKSNPKYLVRKLTGATGIADARVRRVLDPIIKEAEDLKIDKGDLDVYLKAKRDAGFGETGRDIKGSDPVLAGERIQALEDKYGQPIKAIADKLYKYQDEGFQEMIDAGFISPEVGATIKSQNVDYVPFQRVMDEVDSYLGLPTRKLMQGSQPIKNIKGSKKEIYSPLESIMVNTFKQRAAIEKNAVAKSIAGLSEIAPELGFNKVSASGDDTITVWNNGQKEYWSVGTDIAETAKGLNEENTNALLKLFTGPASLLRQGATGRNPEFMLPNIIRDQLDAGISSQYGYIPFVDYISGFKSIITDDAMFKKWESSGAKIDLGSLSGRKTVGEATKPRLGLFSKIGEVLDWMGKYSEQPTRVGLFKRAYKATGDELKSVLESRDATVDFARMGSKMKVANSIIPFLNVGVQGFDKLIRAVKGNPVKVLFNAMLYGALPAATTTLYNLSQHSEEYAEIPQFEKDSNFIIVKGRNKDGTVDYLTMPKGNILPIISNPVQSFLEFAKGESQQTFGEFATQFISSALPVIGDGQSLQEVGIKTIGGNLPQLLKPITENLINKSFYKYDTKKEQSKDIVPSYLQNKPDYKQGYEFTPELYQKIGQVLDVSPLKVQNLLEGYLAGYVKIPANIIDVVKSISDGETPEQNKIPLLRRFMKQTYPTSSTSIPKKEPEKTTIMERLSGEVDAAETIGTTIKYVKDDKEYEVELGKEFVEPKFGSSDPFDKEAISRYKSGISTQINKIYDAYEAGAIEEEVAREAIGKLTLKYTKAKSTKAKKAKKIKAPKFVPIKFGKRKKITGLTKKKKLKLIRAPKLKKVSL